MLLTLLAVLIASAPLQSDVPCSLQGMKVGIRINEARAILTNAVVGIEVKVQDCGESQELQSDWQSLPICIAGRDGVVNEINLCQRILNELYSIDEQDSKEWIDAFSSQQHIHFMNKDIRRKRSIFDFTNGKSYPVRLRQPCFTYINRREKFCILYFGEAEIDAIRGGPMVEKLARDLMRPVPAGTLRILRSEPE